MEKNKLEVQLVKIKKGLLAIIAFSIFFMFFLNDTVAQTKDTVVYTNKDTTKKANKNHDGLEGEKDVGDYLKPLVMPVKHFFKRRKLEAPQITEDSTIEINPLSHPVLNADSVKVKPGKLDFAYFPAVGYTLQTGTTGIIAMNVSFYTGSPENTNISGINVNPQISFNHPQFMLPLNFNIWSNKNKIDFTGDIRFYKYPTYTYGLGGHTQLSNADLVFYDYVRNYLEALKQISTTKYYVGVGYNLDYHFNILEETSGSDFAEYNQTETHTISSGVNVSFLYDSRKNQNYPENASYANLMYRYNSKLFGSTSDYHTVYFEYKKYINITHDSHNVLALWSLDWFTFGGKAPYFDLPSTGWDNYSNTGRGYIQSRLRGPSMVYLEAEYRFRFLKSGILGGTVFANGESVSEWGSNKFETVLPGAGVGLRIKLNKISGANLAIDYGWGVGGSSGLFFNINEVF